LKLRLYIEYLFEELSIISEGIGSNKLERSDGEVFKEIQWRRTVVA